MGKKRFPFRRVLPAGRAQSVPNVAAGEAFQLVK